MSDYITPKIYRTKGKNPKLFIILNGKRKYIQADAKMTEKQVANYVHKNFKIKKTKKAPKKKPKITRKKHPQPKAPQLPAAKPSQLPAAKPSQLPLPLPNRNFPSSFPSIPSQLSQTTKQDIPEVTNLVNELRTYKQLDKKRQEDNMKLEIEKRRHQAETQAALLEKQSAISAKERVELEKQQIQQRNQDAERNLRKITIDIAKRLDHDIKHTKDLLEKTRERLINKAIDDHFDSWQDMQRWGKDNGFRMKKKPKFFTDLRNSDKFEDIVDLEEIEQSAEVRQLKDDIIEESNNFAKWISDFNNTYTDLEPIHIDLRGEYDEEEAGDEEAEEEEDEEDDEDDDEQQGGRRSLKTLLAKRAKLIQQLKGSGVSTDNGLWTNQINKVMQKLPQFVGTVASDQFPTLLNKIKPNSKIAWISNIEPSTKGGSHWVAFVINGTSTPPDAYSIMFFDPFGEDIPKNMLKDLKLIADKISPNVMLKLKISRIQHQDESTNNCGYFSMNFIIDILSRNKTFAQASGFTDRKEDQSGKYEKEIERLKDLPPFNYLDIVDQEGGFIVRSQAPPKVRNFLNKFGGEYIENIAVYRKPILSIIQKAVNWLRKITGREANEQYDKLFHLYLVVTLKDSNRSFKVERNQVLNIEPATQSDLTGENVEAKAIQPPNMTFKEMFDKASGGRAEFFRYHPTMNNCQMFVRDVLQAGGVWTNELSDFIMQDVKDILPKFITDIGGKITDIAHTADIVLEGNGGQKGGCNCGKSNRNFNRL